MNQPTKVGTGIDWVLFSEMLDQNRAIHLFAVDLERRGVFQIRPIREQTGQIIQLERMAFDKVGTSIISNEPSEAKSKFLNEYSNRSSIQAIFKETGEVIKKYESLRSKIAWSHPEAENVLFRAVQRQEQYVEAMKDGVSITQKTQENIHPDESKTEKSILMRFFKSTSVDLKNDEHFEKSLTDDEYRKIEHHLDKERGGLTRYSFSQFKDDKELVKVAQIASVFKDYRAMKNLAPQIRENLLKIFQANGGRILSMDEFKKVSVFLDSRQGGLRKQAYEIFKNDKAVVNAARNHREKWNSKNGREPSPKYAGVTMEILQKKVSLAQEIGKRPHRNVEIER